MITFLKKHWIDASSVFVGSVLLLTWIFSLWAVGVKDFDAPDFLIFVGRFHPTVLHIPIGLMVLSLLMDVSRFVPPCWGLPKGNSNTINFLVFVSASVAIFHGLLLFVGGGYDSSELAERHLFGASAFLTVIGGGYVLRLRVSKVDENRYSNLIISTIAMIVLSISAHDGGSLTHGKNYLTKYSPFTPKEDKDTSSETLLKGNVYEVSVHPIFEAVCVECHQESKDKGELRMDTFAEFQKGMVFEPGSIEDSFFLELMYLPIDDDERMPPEGKPQPTEGQVKVLEWWVEIGAPSEGSLESYNPPSDILDTILAQ